MPGSVPRAIESLTLEGLLWLPCIKGIIAEICTQSENSASPWWLVLLEGIFAAIFGLLILLAPDATLLFLVQTLGFYLLIVGLLRLVGIFTGSSEWVLKLLDGIAGIIGIIIGVIVLRHPSWSALLVPADLFCRRVAGDISGGQQPDPRLQRRWMGVGILGILGIVLGVILVLNPLIGVVAIPFVLGGQC